MTAQKQVETMYMMEDGPTAGFLDDSEWWFFILFWPANSDFDLFQHGLPSSAEYDV